MNKRILEAVVVLACCLPLDAISQQATRLPRDTEKLISRAQSFWASLATNRKTTALPFVLPEKQEAFLSGSAMPVLAAEVLGVDLTDKADRATVRVRLQVMTPGSGRLDWTFSSNWLWRSGNWYADIGEPSELMASRTAVDDARVEEMRQAIDSTLELMQPALELGTIDRGRSYDFRVPVKYSGEYPLIVDSAVPSSILSVSAEKVTLDRNSNHFLLFLNTAEMEGPFSIPLRVRFRREAAHVERVLTVSGNVFVAIAMRQQRASDSPDRISVFIKNNTAEPIPVAYLNAAGLLDIIKGVSVLEPHQEHEVVVQRRPDVTPENLIVVTRSPVQGRTEFAIRPQFGQ